MANMVLGGIGLFGCLSVVVVGGLAFYLNWREDRGR